MVNLKNRNNNSRKPKSSPPTILNDRPNSNFVGKVFRQKLVRIIHKQFDSIAWRSNFELKESNLLNRAGMVTPCFLFRERNLDSRHQLNAVFGRLSGELVFPPLKTSRVTSAAFTFKIGATIASATRKSGFSIMVLLFCYLLKGKTKLLHNPNSHSRQEKYLTKPHKHFQF